MMWLGFFLPFLLLGNAATIQTVGEEKIVASEKFQTPVEHMKWTTFQLEGEEPLEKTADLGSIFGAFKSEFEEQEQEQAVEGAEAGYFRLNPARGGRGGGWFNQDCMNYRRGTLRYVEMRCGHFVGRVRLHCMAGAFGYSGAGRGHGSGPYRHFWSPITKMLVGAGAYVDRVTFYRENRYMGYCGRSGGGGKYWCHAPNRTYQLCAIRGRAGWWMDQWQCGWCTGPSTGYRGISVNWWGSFDRRGWSKCPHGRLMTGIWRNTCNWLYCIEEVGCETPRVGSATQCRTANWWHAFDKRGWSWCPTHYFIAGFWKNSCNYLYCIENAHCCRPPGSTRSHLGVANWWSSFDRLGYSVVPENRYIFGVWRNSCNWLYCIEQVYYGYMRKAPVHCLMWGWRGWGRCSTTCGWGTRWRYRSYRRHPKNGGRRCPTNRQSQRCHPKHCAIHCAVSGWGRWGGCNKRCGGGLQYSSRRVTRHPKYGGRRCPGLRQSRRCNVRACPVNCAVSGWRGWGRCSASCGWGTQYRYRRVTRPNRHGGRGCPTLRNARRCHKKPCAVHCKVSGWTKFSKCSKACGLGSQSRTRRVLVGAKSGGRRCPSLKEARKCQIKPCPVNCIMNGWTKWTKCSKSCGGGLKSRKRSIKRNDKYGGKKCGRTFEQKKCNSKKCPIHCKVGRWLNPGPCSKKCGGGTRVFRRRIVVVAKHGGKKCPSLSKTSKCNTQKCPINGKWGKFGKWGPCTRICGGGISRRTRKCDKPSPRYGGKSCRGGAAESNACNTLKCSSVSNCKDVNVIYTKTMAELKGQLKVSSKNVAAAGVGLKYALDEVNDGKVLLAKIKTLKAGSAKKKMLKLVTKMYNEALAALAKYKKQKKTESVKKITYSKRITKLAKTKKKCSCDTKRKELVPVIDRAEAKIKNNDKLIRAQMKALSMLRSQKVVLAAKKAGFAWMPQPIRKMMEGMMNSMISITDATIKKVLASIKKAQKQNKYWSSKLAGFKAKMGHCLKETKAAGKKLKKLLEEFDMMHIWEETEFGDMQSDYREWYESDMAEFHETYMASAHFMDVELQAAEQTTSSTTTTNYAEYGLSGLMIVGGLFAFVAGRRVKNDEYENLEA